MENKNLIEISDKNGILLKKKFEEFLKKTNLDIHGDIAYYLREKSNFLSFLNIDIAKIFFYEDWISVHINEENLKRVKKLFEDFIKINKVRVVLHVENE
jgi:hypothetical protein